MSVLFLAFVQVPNLFCLKLDEFICFLEFFSQFSVLSPQNGVLLPGFVQFVGLIVKVISHAVISLDFVLK